MAGFASGPWTLTARWIIPVEGPPLEGGTVTISGDRLMAVEPHGTRAADLDLCDMAVLPGLVNAHVHLDLSGLKGGGAPVADFTSWLRSIIRHRRDQSVDETDQAIQAGLEESLVFGTTLLGDVSASGQSWTALAAAPLRAV